MLRAPGSTEGTTGASKRTLRQPPSCSLEVSSHPLPCRQLRKKTEPYSTSLATGFSFGCLKKSIRFSTIGCERILMHGRSIIT